MATPSDPAKRRMGVTMTLREYWLLIQFMTPLIITQMAPEFAEQVLNRSITSVTTDEMEQLLASFGLAFSIVKFIGSGPFEMKPVGLILATNKRNYWRVLKVSVVVGIFSGAITLAIGLTPLGSFLYEDVHQVSYGTSEETKTIMIYLAPLPILQSVGMYHEGLLIMKKRTGLTGIVHLADCGLEILFTIILLALPTRTVPVLIPVFSVYAGYIGRLVLSVGFFYVTVFRELDEDGDNQETVSYKSIFSFWFPLAFTKGVATIGRPIMNLFVARNQAPYGKSETALAILTAVYPVARFTVGFLIELRMIIPSFYKETKQHRKYSFLELSMFSASVLLFSICLNESCFWIPGAAYGIMRYGVGLTHSLAQQSVVPLRIFSVAPPLIGIRTFVTGWLLMHRKTTGVALAAFVRLGMNISTLIVAPLVNLNGPEMGTACLAVGYFGESLIIITCSFIIKRWFLGSTNIEKKEAISTPLIFTDDTNAAEMEDFSPALSIHKSLHEQTACQSFPTADKSNFLRPPGQFQPTDLLKPGSYLHLAISRESVFALE